MASPTADGVANLTEMGNPGDVATPGDKVDDVHEEKPELEEPKMTPSTTLALLQAEMGSVVKSMSDLVKVKEEDQITPYVKGSDEVDAMRIQRCALDIVFFRQKLFH